MSETMSEVTVQFFGICTHVFPEAGASQQHQVILVNASDPRRLTGYLEKMNVKPHAARLQLEAHELVEGQIWPEWFTPLSQGPQRRDRLPVVVWSLPGVILTIPGASGRVEAPTQPCIPSLSNYSTVARLPLPTNGLGNPEKTACLVELPLVTVSGRNFQKGAAVGVVTVDVTEPPGLVVTLFGGKSFTILLKPGATITISNFPVVETEEKDQDFLLHFLTMYDDVPDGTKYPEVALGCTTLIDRNIPVMPPRVPVKRGEWGMSGPGCSNSTYP